MGVWMRRGSCARVRTGRAVTRWFSGLAGRRAGSRPARLAPRSPTCVATMAGPPDAAAAASSLNLYLVKHWMVGHGGWRLGGAVGHGGWARRLGVQGPG
jgi:hypothetical protein